ncbi:hypothetical protein GCM10011491_23820 [Brucella endophytica]|uniref:Mutator family transposase n=1 Tax=Brucella endophytica TaxID=1963359 RepID=A0A916SDM7_9HYPH|nr:hypothetical protein GCM10011491_23820 [Brucella endophytica]
MLWHAHYQSAVRIKRSVRYLDSLRTNRRNGHSKKTVLIGTPRMDLSIPRDRTSSVDPKLISLVDGLKGFPEAIGVVFPQTIVHICIVH